MHTISRRTFQAFITACASLLLASVLAGPPGAMAQSVREFVPMDSLAVGDTFNYSIRLDKNQVYDRVLFPDSSHFAGPFEIRNLQQFKVTDFRDSLSYHMQFFGTADTTIPPLPVRLVSGTDTTTLYTNPVPVRFKSVLQSQDEAFRPLKPIFDFAAAWWPVLLGLLLLGVAAWYLYGLWKKKRDSTTKEPRQPFRATPFRDPLTELQDTLRQLEKTDLQNEEDFEQFYIIMGDAIRTYFEVLYEIPALEMTSREILTAMREDSVDEELVRATRIVLNEADLVKFARFEPTVEQSERALEKARAFVQRAREIDGPRIEQLRRRHNEEMSEARERYNRRMREEADGESDEQPSKKPREESTETTPDAEPEQKSDDKEEDR